MSNGHVLVLDEGTTSTRAVLFDERSQVVTSSSEPLDIRTYPDGRVEQDADEIWTKSRKVLADVISEAAQRGLGISDLGMAAQRTTTVVWDAETGRPLAPVVSWQDTRCADEVSALNAAWAEPAAATTGMILSAANCGLHLGWLAEHDPRLRERAAAGRLLAGSPDSWVIWNLTGGADGGRFVTSSSCAGSTGMMDFGSHSWWKEFLDAIGVPDGVLPQILPEDGDYGTTRADLVGVALPITGVVGDQQSALYGQGGFGAGSVKCTHGTGSFIDFNIGPRPIVPGNGLDCRVAWTTALTSAHVLEGGSFVTGSGVDWLIGGLKMLPGAAQLDATYAEGNPDSGLISVPALAGFAAPHWDSAARGMMIGFNRGTTAADVIRATVDGIAHTVTDVLDAMASSAGVAPTMIWVDGGLGRSDALLQAQADLMQVPVMRAAQSEWITARGAAWCAGIATGVWDSLDAANATKEEGRVFEPAMGDRERELRRAAWQDAVNRALGWRITTAGEAV